MCGFRFPRRYGVLTPVERGPARFSGRRVGRTSAVIDKNDGKTRIERPSTPRVSRNARDTGRPRFSGFRPSVCPFRYTYRYITNALVFRTHVRCLHNVYGFYFVLPKQRRIGPTRLSITIGNITDGRWLTVRVQTIPFIRLYIVCVYVYLHLRFTYHTRTTYACIYLCILSMWPLYVFVQAFRLDLRSVRQSPSIVWYVVRLLISSSDSIFVLNTNI